jgi:HSP20 family protein
MSKTADKKVTSEPGPTPAAPTPDAVAPMRQDAPVPWADPIVHLRRFRDEFDRVLGGLGFGRNFAFPTFESLDLPKRFGEMARVAWSPQVEVLERDGKIVLRADLPGVAKSDLSVEIDDGIVAIKGERRTQSEEKSERYFRSERTYGHFYRTFRLPEGADVTKVKANFKDGVLEVEIPAAAKPKSTTQKIEIEEAKNT